MNDQWHNELRNFGRSSNITLIAIVVLNVNLASCGPVQVGSAVPPIAAPAVPGFSAARDSSDCIPSQTRPFPESTSAAPWHSRTFRSAEPTHMHTTTDNIAVLLFIDGLHGR